MSTYKIRVQIDMIPCDEPPTREPMKEHDGSLSIVLSEADAIKIDACEQALLQTTYPRLREALATHLSEVSKKKPLSSRGRGSVSRIRGPIGSMVKLAGSIFRRIMSVRTNVSCMIRPVRCLRR
jgi:hypothetical protein